MVTVRLSHSACTRGELSGVLGEAMKKKARKKKARKHIVLATLKPEHTAALVDFPEPVVVAAVPKSLWEKFLEWLAGS